MADPKRGPGRPPREEGVTRRQVRLPVELWRQVEEAAARDGRAVDAWIRRVLQRALERP